MYRYEKFTVELAVGFAQALSNKASKASKSDFQIQMFSCIQWEYKWYTHTSGYMASVISEVHTMYLQAI